MSITPLVSPHLLLHPPISQLPNCINFRVRCQSSELSPSEGPTGSGHNELGIGSPTILVAAPATLKTAISMPCLRVNNGLVKPGDVGRIVSRKPKDVWAVRLAIGTYLIDGKHFKPLGSRQMNSNLPVTEYKFTNVESI